MADSYRAARPKAINIFSLQYPARCTLFKIVKIGRTNGKSCTSVFVAAVAEAEKSTGDYRQVAWQNSCLAKDAQGLYN
jgi:hypothetical protein